MSDVDKELDSLYHRSFGRYVPGLRYVGIRKVVPGGLFSPPDYQSCRPKGKRTVIILKEPWSTNGAGWNWRTEGQKAIALYSQDEPIGDGWGPLMSQMGRLAYLIAVRPPPARYQHLPAFGAVTRPERAKGLSCMGIMNVKKTTDGTGYKTTSDTLVKRWAASTMNILTEELEIMDPDIVLCGGKAVYEAMATGLSAQPQMQKTISTKEFQCSHCRVGPRQGVKLIEVYHPSQAPPRPSYEFLKWLKHEGFV